MLLRLATTGTAVQQEHSVLGIVSALLSPAPCLARLHATTTTMIRQEYRQFTRLARRVGDASDTFQIDLPVGGF